MLRYLFPGRQLASLSIMASVVIPVGKNPYLLAGSGIIIPETRAGYGGFLSFRYREDILAIQR
jgi:hypothetical protein